MYYMLGFLIVIVFISLVYVASKAGWSPKNLMIEAAYQSYYYILGTTAIVEDFFYRRWNQTELLPRPGEVAVITGGARGLGVEVVKGLLQCCMHVVIGCRNVDAGNKTIEKIRSQGIQNGTAECLPLDMASMKSIENFSKAILEECPQINILINNAGIMFVPYALTDDGFESHFAVNYLGHCFLTHLLLPRLKQSGQIKGRNSRIVSVSSCAHKAGSINFEDFTMRKLYIPSASYAQSKLAQILFTNKLELLVRSEGAPVQTHSIHPGIVNTDLFNGTLLKTVAPWVPALIFKTPSEGAASVLHACFSPSLEGCGGTYISNCRVTGTSSKAMCQKTQDKLWSVMLKMLRVEVFGRGGILNDG